MNNLTRKDVTAKDTIALIGKTPNPSAAMNAITDAIFLGGAYMRAAAKFLRECGLTEEDIKVLYNISMQIHCPKKPNLRYIGKDGRDYNSLEALKKTNQMYMQSVYTKKPRSGYGRKH